MKIALTWTDPYIKSRHEARNAIIFKGTLKECRAELLRLFNEYSQSYAESIRQAHALTKNIYDSMNFGKHGKAFFYYDSRLFEIIGNYDTRYNAYFRDY